MLDERAVLQFAHCLLQLGLGVHHDRPVPGDRLFDRFPGHQQKPDAGLAGLHRSEIAIDNRGIGKSTVVRELGYYLHQTHGQAIGNAM